MDALSENTNYSDFSLSGSVVDYELYGTIEFKKCFGCVFKLNVRPDLNLVLQIGAIDPEDEQIEFMKFYLQTLQMILKECGWLILSIKDQQSRCDIWLETDELSERRIGNVPEPSTSIFSLSGFKNGWIFYLHVKTFFVLFVSGFQNFNVFLKDFLALGLTFRLKLCRLKFAGLHAFLVLIHEVKVNLHPFLPFRRVNGFDFGSMDYLFFYHYAVLNLVMKVEL